MSAVREEIEKFEYKGREITVQKDSKGKKFFIYEDEGVPVDIGIEEIESFINGAFTHATINNTPVDMIERSVKINGLLFDLKDLKVKIQKYK